MNTIRDQSRSGRRKKARARATCRDNKREPSEAQDASEDDGISGDPGTSTRGDRKGGSPAAAVISCATVKGSKRVTHVTWDRRVPTPAATARGVGVAER